MTLYANIGLRVQISRSPDMYKLKTGSTKILCRTNGATQLKIRQNQTVLSGTLELRPEAFQCTALTVQVDFLVARSAKVCSSSDC